MVLIGIGSNFILGGGGGKFELRMAAPLGKFGILDAMRSFLGQFGILDTLRSFLGQFEILDTLR